MLQLLRNKVAIAACGALLLCASSAEAGFSLAPGTPDPASGNGTAYSWYYDSIDMWFANPDGFLPYVVQGQTHYAAYITLQGTDASPNGHCVELTLAPGTAPIVRLIVDDHGNYVTVNEVVTSAGYSTATRLWLNHTTGPSLSWSVLFAAEDDSGNNETFSLAIKRLEIDKAHCTTGSNGAWMSFEGSTSAYTFTHNPF
jgi:hypothetical protein